jgi:hypothetical protein
MGYSGRYHTASLVAVFIALAIGILIGVGLAGDVVSGASQELEQSLRSDLDEANEESDRLATELEREREFGSRAYPALVAGRMAGIELALIGLGSLPRETAADVEAAIEPAGARLAAIAVVEMPPDAEELAASAGRRYSGAARGGQPLSRLGEDLGAELAGGGALVERVRDVLFARFSGELAEVEGLILVGSPPGDLDEDQQALSDALRDGLLSGIAGNGAEVAGAERTDTDPATLAPISDAGIATVDHVDLVAGKVSLVLSLLGAGGDFGVKEGAEGFLPELLGPSRGAR